MKGWPFESEDKIETERFLLRSLNENDATLEYLSWLHNGETSQFILSASTFKGLQELRDFIAAKSADPGVLFLGIFSKQDHSHIGNIKFERLASCEQCSDMGVLIGAKDWRGKGVFKEVFLGVVEWMRASATVKRIFLGVAKENDFAVRSYLKTGFVQSDNSTLKVPDGNIEMEFII